MCMCIHGPPVCAIMHRRRMWRMRMWRMRMCTCAAPQALPLNSRLGGLAGGLQPNHRLSKWHEEAETMAAARMLSKELMRLYKVRDPY